eukprot:s1417_g8.t1
MHFMVRVAQISKFWIRCFKWSLSRRDSHGLGRCPSAQKKAIANSNLVRGRRVYARSRAELNVLRSMAVTFPGEVTTRHLTMADHPKRCGWNACR